MMNHVRDMEQEMLQLSHENEELKQKHASPPM